MRICERSSPVGTQVNEGGGRGGGDAPPEDVRYKMLLQEVPDTRFLPLQPLADPKPEQVDPEGGCDPMGNTCWSRRERGNMR